MKKITLFAAVLCATAPAFSQKSLPSDLKKLVETPGVTGYESEIAAAIQAAARPRVLERDNLGNLFITLGEGSPHRVIAAPMDEPGYVVSAITDDGFLRVQRLPQTAPHGLFDQLHFAQPVQILTRKGKWVTGVVAGLSTHLQGARRDGPRSNHPDDMYVDIGASSHVEVRQAGVDVLDPISIERQLFPMGFNKMAGNALGDRFGAAALLELLRRIDPAKLRGKLTIAFVTQQWAGARGLDRLTQHIKADELVYVGRLRRAAGRPGGGQGATQRGQGAQQPQEAASNIPGANPGEGVLIVGSESAGSLAAEIAGAARDKGIATKAAVSATIRGPVLPSRFAHLSIPTEWAITPGETADITDLRGLTALLEYYAQGSMTQVAASEIPTWKTAEPWKRPTTAPSNTTILSRLVEAYGVSGYEAASREAVKNLLPPWAKPVTDEKGNVILHLGKKTKGSKAPRITFVAHDDELGYVIENITAEGRLVVTSRGGGTSYFYAGHPVLVHTANGDRAGVIELPANWRAADFEWPRGLGAPAQTAASSDEGEQADSQARPAAGARQLLVDVGARNAAQVAELGIKEKDWITIPKKYRPLFGTRANGRSFDDRLGCTALISAVWALGPDLPDRDITFVWSVEEEVGLRGAHADADSAAKRGEAPDYVFAVDTFVSADSPLESSRFANAPIGKGFVIRAVDNSNITDRKYVDKLLALARANQIPVQYGVTGGGNDGSAYLKHGTVDVPIAWPLRYSHSPGEVIDTRDVDALARIVAVIARSW
jgi:putative aminopeptidase